MPDVEGVPEDAMVIGQCGKQGRTLIAVVPAREERYPLLIQVWDGKTAVEIELTRDNWIMLASSVGRALGKLARGGPA
jgi:hypothetical protein